MADLSLPWDGWWCDTNPTSITLTCDAAPLVVYFMRLDEDRWTGAYSIDGACRVQLISSERLDLMERRVVWAIRDALRDEHQQLAKKQAALSPMLMTLSPMLVKVNLD